MEEQGASNNERLRYAARTDDEDMLLEIFNHPDSFDINAVDGLGNTVLHIAVANGSVNNLEHILSHDECDVDPQNRLGKQTPLHLAMALDNPGLRLHIVQSLLDAGANTRIKDKNGDTALDLAHPNEELKKAIRKAQAMASISRDDIADDDDGPGSDSD